MKENGFNNVLLNPTQDEFYKYSCNDCIILIPLISKCPYDQKNHKTTIEKITVDLFSKNIWKCLYDEAELSYMIRNILLSFKVKYNTLRNYAIRRHSLDVLLGYSPEIVKDIFHDKRGNIYKSKH